MVRKKGIPVRNLKNNTLQILTARVESLEREERERIRATEGNQQRQNNSNINNIVNNVNNSNNNGKSVRPKRRVCHVCDKGFDRPSALDTHMLVHNGLKPFKCHVCEYAYDIWWFDNSLARAFRREAVQMSRLRESVFRF